MSTYTKKNQNLVAVNNGAAAPTYQLDNASAAKKNNSTAAKTTAETTKPVKYQGTPADRTQYQYDANSNAAYQQALNALLAAQKDKPTYAGTYDGQLDQIYNQIVNRKPFIYDVNKDMLYQQYADQYLTKGNLAMRDTMGQAAALTGGYGNTFAQIAGQQQYDAYLQQLNEVVPQLYGMAQDQYYREGEALQNQFAMTGDLSDREYGRYQDALNNYWQNVSYLQGQADNEYNRGYENWYNAEQMGMQQDQMNYQKYLDEYDRNYQREQDIWNQNFQQEQWQYQQEQDAYDRQYQELLDNWNQSFQESQFAYQKEQDSLSNQWRDKEYQTQQTQIAYEKQLQAYNTLSELITATGYAPSAAELQAAGMTQAQADAYRNYYSQQQAQAAQAAASRSSGSPGYTPPVGDGGDGGDGDGNDPDKEPEYAYPNNYNEAVSLLKGYGIDTSSLLSLSDWSKNKALSVRHFGGIGEPGSARYEKYKDYQEYLATQTNYLLGLIDVPAGW